MTQGFRQVQAVDYFQRFAPTPSLARIKVLAAAAKEHGVKIVLVAVANAFVQAKHDYNIYMKLPCWHRDISGKTVGLNRSLFRQK